jgi:hypothetical protein
LSHLVVSLDHSALAASHFFCVHFEMSSIFEAAARAGRPASYPH